MRSNLLNLASSFYLVALSGCVQQVALEPDLDVEDPPNENPQQNMAECGLPIPGAELYLLRSKGAPNEAELEIPGLTSVCLKIETNAASATVSLDGSDVATPSDFHNEEQVVFHSVYGLAPDPHTISVRIAGKPDEHYIRVTAHYISGADALSESPAISSTDEALLVGQAYVDAHSDVPSFSNWIGATAIRATPLYSLDGPLEAFAIDIQGLMGVQAGYLVLEAHKLRPLLGAAKTEGSPLTELLAGRYKEEYGQELDESKEVTFLWADLAVMGLRVTTLNDEVRHLQTCEHYECPGVTFDGAMRPFVDYAELGLSEQKWIDERQSLIDLLFKMQADTEMNGASAGSNSTFIRGNSGAPERPQAIPRKTDVHVPVGLQMSCESESGAVKDLRIPGGRAALAAQHQISIQWPNDKVVSPTGCSPVAVLIALEYWDARYKYLLKGEHDPATSGPDDPEILTMTKAIRAALQTKPVQGDNEKWQGSTQIGDVFDDRLLGFISGRAKEVGGENADALWLSDTTDCGQVGEISLRRKLLLESVGRGTPPILHYNVFADNNSCPADSINHSAVVYGYTKYEDGRPDQVHIARGWQNVDKTPDDDSTQIIDINHGGGMFVTQLRPGCDVPSSDGDLCMSFSDISPDLSWGRPSTETLSCMCVMRGEPDGKFRPNDSISKAEFLKVVLKLAYNASEVDLDGARSDKVIHGVCPSHWASGYIEFAGKQGLLDGLLSGDVFAADEPITRKEAAWLLVEAGAHHDDGSPPGVGTSFWTFYKMYKDYKCFSGKNTVDSNPYIDFSPLEYLPTYDHILASTNRCVFEGIKVDPEDPNSEREFRPDEAITRIGAAKVACTARFGGGSSKCSTEFDCLELAVLGCQ